MKFMSLKPDEMVVSLKIKKAIVKLVDSERSVYSMPRSSWIIQAIVEKLDRLGLEINFDVKEEEE
jgi:hypothetical protein